MQKSNKEKSGVTMALQKNYSTSHIEVLWASEEQA